MTDLAELAGRDAMPGDRVIFREYNLSSREIAKVTDKLFKLEGRQHPRQINRSDRRIVCVVRLDVNEAGQLRNSIAGADGEFNRRRAAADAERNERVKAAAVARDATIARLVNEALRARAAQQTEGAK